jgi:TonB family protein
MVLEAAAVFAFMCKACEEQAGNPFGFGVGRSAYRSVSADSAPVIKGVSPASSTPGPATDDSAIVVPKFVKRVSPEFPAQALRDGVEGRVVAKFQIAPDGVPYNVKIERSDDPVFDQTVIRALSRSRFAPEPALYSGRWYKQPYSFRMEEAAPSHPTPPPPEPAL